MMMDFPIGSVVEWQEEGKTCYGVVCSEIAGASVCTEWETPVHPISKKGFGIYEGMATESLKLADKIPPEYHLTEDHVRNFCQPGKDEATCKYLVMGIDGGQCAKGSVIRLIWDFVFANTKAKGDNCLGKIGAANDI
jgi:hypothetical protein